MTRFMLAGLLGLLLVAPLPNAQGADGLLVADFDSGAKPNNLGDDFGAWSRDPEDFTQGCYEEFNKAHARGGEGSCMMLEYDVDSPKPAFNGFWMKFSDLDVSAYDNLVLWMKSDPEKGGASRLKIEMKTDAERGAHYIDGVGSEWKRFEIPLFDFLISDYTKLQEMVLVFEDHTARPKEGVIYIDDVSFEKAAPQEPEAKPEAAAEEPKAGPEAEPKAE